MKARIQSLDTLMEKCNTAKEFDWMNSSQAAEYLKLDVNTLMNLSSNGTVPYYKLGRKNLYLKSELDKIIQLNPRGVRPWE